MNLKKPDNSTMAFLSVLCILLFIYGFFYTTIHLPIYQLDYNLNNLQISPDHIIQLINVIHDSMFKILLCVMVFSIICLVMIFQSSFRLLFNKDQLQIDVGISEKEITPGTDGVKLVANEKGQIPLYNAEVYRQLTEDYIISDVSPDGKPIGFITMDSFLRGFKSYCESQECDRDLETIREVKKDRVYAPEEYVRFGENITSVANKMLTKKLSALPVVDENGCMRGSIHYLQVIQLLTQKMEELKNR
ncbi:CBS domain-containing protein [Desulforamulus aeronauticus]|uniref:CBS domain-containing protein n=1 Tax=Desulforamulus aeronauticus DSM 10349 TaxID=1121421 RepID=A0A1M6RJ91_9FIRM|nr:CBS domain-containing protein [Desulforamulus aeronauticus]SHK32486.1 hypothetical protein SAMN02745123_01470 [Desulforamulus aeronauticus DSM 10349]